MKVWVLMCQCDDSYYPGNIAGQNKAFASKEAAEAELKKLNHPDDDDPYFYLHEVDVEEVK